MNIAGANLKLPSSSEMLRSAYVICFIAVFIVLGSAFNSLSREGLSLIVCASFSSVVASSLNLRFGRTFGDTALTIGCYILGFLLMKLFF